MDAEAATRFVREHTAVVSPPLLPELKLHLATEITPLWEKTQEWLDRHAVSAPFWAFAWVGGQALARFVLDRPERVRGKVVLDFAAGSGIVGIAAARAGAKRVVSCDVDPLAVHAIALNAALNDVTVVAELVDRIDDPLDGFDVLLAGDVCYEQPMAERVTRWGLSRARAGVDVVVGDPGRAYLFDGAVLEALARYDVATASDVEASAVRTATVWSVRPPRASAADL